jgi:peptide/nickel transport system substrate-binding protein
VPDHWAGFAHDTSPNVFRYVVYRESTPARLALEAGDVQWFPGLNEEDFTLLKEKDGIETLFRPSLTLDWIFMNTASEGPLGDANVRKALRNAFDYAAADAVLFDLNGTNYVMPPSIPGAVEFPDIQKTDLDLAKEYLAKSQWPDGGFELNYIYIGGYSPEQDAGLVLLEAASKLNITVKMIPKTWSEMVQMCSDTTTIPDMVNIYIGAAYSDPDPYFSQAFSLNNSNGFANCHRYLKQELSDKLSQASTEPDAAKRTEMYSEIQQEVYDSAFGILIGTLDFIEAHDSHWQADSFTPLFAYLGYIPDYYYVP